MPNVFWRRSSRTPLPEAPHQSSVIGTPMRECDCLMSFTRLGCLAALLLGLPTWTCLAAAAVPGNVKLSRPLKKYVVATHRLFAKEEQAAEDVHCYLLLPEEGPRQRIQSILFSPEPKAVTTDEHGRRIAHFRIPRIAPGGHVAVRWVAKVTTYDMKAYAHESRRSPDAGLSGKLKRLYLKDGAKYGIRSATIRQVAKSVAPRGASPLTITKRISEYLSENLTYERVGGWDAAEEVLQRGTGSCSEYAFCVIALCRARGVPARYVGSTTCRRKTKCGFDRAKHRWAEAYVAGCGWVQVDPLQRDALKENAFWVTNRRLTLGRGDGRAESPLGWEYTGRATGKGGLDAHEEFFWCGRLPQATFEQVLKAGGVFGTRRKPSPRKAVRELAAIGKDLCLPFLADHLWGENADTAEQAAKAICRLDVLSARNVRYFARRHPQALRVMSRALEARALGRRRKKTGKWVRLFDGKKLLARSGECGPFEIRDGWLTNAKGTGTMLARHTTGGRYIIDLLFRHSGPGRAALVFGHSDKHTFLKLPFHVPKEPYLKKNYLAGTKCRKGLYGAEEGKLHRATISVDGYLVRLDFDGRTVFELDHPDAGPGRIGLTVWGEKTRFGARHLRVMDVAGGRSISRLLASPRVMALKE